MDRRERVTRVSRFLKSTAAAVLAAGVLSGAALADDLCGNAGGTICCGDQTWLPLYNIAVSQWTGDAGHHYYARRQNYLEELTYNHYVYNGGDWDFDNGTDVMRGTGIYYGGQTQIDFAIWSITHTSC